MSSPGSSWRDLEPRRGSGGGGSGHGGGHGGHRGSSNRTLGQPDMTEVSQTPFEIFYAGESYIATPFSYGDDEQRVIPAKRPFSGRQAGGGTRAHVFGTSVYGSGYPDGSDTRGVAGRALPFHYWPVVFVPVVESETSPAYLFSSDEYGSPSNSTRPGGPLHQVAFTSGNTTVRVVSDNSTVECLYQAISYACRRATNASFSATLPGAYDQSLSGGPFPGPEQSIQYYRASTVALTLDGYNNTAVFDDQGVPPAPLPRGADPYLIMCTNMTIGRTVPFVVENGAGFINLGPGTLVEFVIGVWILKLLGSWFV